MGLPDEGERKNTKENKKMIHKIDNTIEEKYIELANKRVRIYTRECSTLAYMTYSDAKP